MPMARIPPQAPPLFNASPDSLIEDAKRIVREAMSLREHLVATIPPENRTFDRVCRPLAVNAGEFERTGQPIRLLQACSPDPELRKAATEAKQIMSKFYVEASSKEEFFKLYEDVHEKHETLDPQSQYFIDRVYDDYIRSGATITNSEVRGRLKDLKHRVSEMTLKFQTNLNNDDSGLWFTEDELQGVPKDTYSVWSMGAGENEGKLKMPFKGPTSRTVLQKAENPNTRMRVAIGESSRCAENIPLFMQIIKLKDQKARLLGYPSHAHYNLGTLMAKTPKFVVAFLEDLKDRIRPGGEKDAKRYLELKKSIMANDSVEPELTDKVFTWDAPYLRAKLLEKEYQIDNDQIKDYFPVQTTLRRMLLIFEKLFKIEFIELHTVDKRKISPTGKAEDVVWHENVDMFAVWDADSIGGEFVGYLYTDLHPREGKYYHNADFNIQQGFDAADGSRRYPATALICNLSKATDTHPGLLQHREVITMFHELGHGIHDLLARTKYSRFHGYAVKRDFGEAPSQMLENWCWQPEQLRFISCHWSHLSEEYEQEWRRCHPEETVLPPKQIPQHLIDSLVGTKRVYESLLVLRQLHFGLFDQKVHGPMNHDDMQERDYVVLYNKMQADLTCLAGPESLGQGFDWGTGPATFGHIIAGQDGVYYSYLLSETWSSDMFHTKFAKDPMDSEVGMQYRRSILEKGGSRDELEGLTEFLGRPPSSEAFYRELGLA